MFLTFTAYALDGFAYAVEACSGEAYGAKDAKRLLLIWHAACRQAGLVALAFSILYGLAGTHIVALLTSIPELQQQADAYLFWQIVLPVCGVWCYLLDGMFIGATRASEMRNGMLIAALGYGATLFTVPGVRQPWSVAGRYRVPAAAWADLVAHLAQALAQQQLVCGLK